LSDLIYGKVGRLLGLDGLLLSIDFLSALRRPLFHTDLPFKFALIISRTQEAEEGNKEFRAKRNT
jgi:hypothetical protein